MTFAALGLAVDSSTVAAATPALQKMAAASAQAEAAAQDLGRASASSAALMQKMLGVMESMERDLTVLTHNALDTGRALATIGPSAQRGFSTASMAMLNSRNLMFQLVDIGQGLPLLLSGNIYGLQNIGFQIAQIGQLYWGQGGFGAALRDAGGILGPLASKLAPVAIAVGVVAVAIAAMTTEINRNQKQQVSWTDVVAASWQLATERIMRFIQPVLNIIGGWWNTVSPFVVAGVNSLIGVFDLAFRDIETIWNMLPAALGDVVFTAAQNTVNGITWMVREAIASINGLISGVNGLLTQAGLPTIANLGNPNEVVPDVDIPNPFAGSDKAFVRQMAQNRGDVAGTDYVGNIGDRAREIARLGEETDKAASGLKAANDNGNAFSKMLSDVAPLLHDANDPLRDLQSNMDKLGALLAAGEISWEQYGEAVNKANLNAASGVLGAVGQITGALAGAFEDNKAFAVANAVINTAEGVTKALAQGGIFGFASAAAIGISGAAQVASILSAKPGSASTTPVSASAGQAAAPAQQGSAINLTIRGSGSVNVDEIADQLRKSIANGGNSGLVKVIREA